jgi:probable F420-dependent oxidoreductase
MRFGLALPHYGFSLPDGEPISFDAVAAWGRRAEDLGFDSVWVSDHLLYSFARYGAGDDPIPAIEPLTAIAGLAAITGRIRLGTLVLCSPFRHPSILAKAAVTIDAISGGRLDLGLGAGWLQQEFDAFGYRFGTTGERFEWLEGTLGALDALMSGEPATLDVGPARLRDARCLPAPVQRPRIPLWVGGKGGPRLLRLVARYADGWNAVWRWTPEGFAARMRAAAAACEVEGRDPSTLRFSVGLYSLLGEDERSFRAVLERGRSAMPGGAIDAETEVSWRADTLSGTPEQALERVYAFEAIGVEEIVVSPWVLPFAVTEPDQVDLFAERVMGPVRDRA